MNTVDSNPLQKKWKNSLICSALLLGLSVAAPSFGAEDIPPPPDSGVPSVMSTDDGIPRTPPPDLPAEVKSSEEPIHPDEDITTIRRDDGLFEEHRINGRLVYVKVTPKKGRPYYLIDLDGDGSLETKRHELDNPTIQQWKLMEW